MAEAPSGETSRGAALIAALAATPHDAGALDAVTAALEDGAVDWTGAAPQAFSLMRHGSLSKAVRRAAERVLGTTMAAHRLRCADAVKRGVEVPPSGLPVSELEDRVVPCKMCTP
jgi:hypothetical protein